MFSIFEVVDYFQHQGVAFVTRLCVAILIGAALYLLGRGVSAGLIRIVRSGRAANLAPTLASFLHVAVAVISVLTMLGHIGVNVTALVAGAGVFGVALGFGSQALVRDIISGFFLLFDGALSPGDLVKIGDVQGVVESVGLRATQVRAISGQLFYIPNGQITVVGNASRGWNRAIVDIGVAYEQDTRRGLSVLQQVAQQWAKDNKAICLEPPEVQGIVSLNASDVGLRVIVKVKQGMQGIAERELRTRIKSEFDAQGIDIPFPRHVIYHRREEQTESPGSDSSPFFD
ncbi:MAG TPA: mechanosensitive ion channel family protein [Polyangiaceae bacterium]|nr:MAG: putative MscS family protein YkuT [Deltaproteobacteria bacterium ADurb.Bin207]HNS97166.1 mechanosensitive ion channel family protein [Polyangiaceae bacterium]HNZ23548.1 mechanosensitive ion channel family protein [Polyangiaceae bacterium]HOD24214.1 mechanosensitive ion channel family protein [Polyangiaceae bacterium]HOE51450.1 mechanosensitive ion channel family protein [Polyangiaceae bacterium]